MSKINKQTSDFTSLPVGFILSRFFFAHLSKGFGDEDGLGDLMLADVGGATTDI